MNQVSTSEQQQRRGRSFRTAIVGGGKGCRSVLEMVRDDALGRFPMDIVGVAELDPDAPGVQLAREIGVELVTTDHRELFELEDLALVIELTGDEEVRDLIERTRPRSVKFIDHFGARLFWELHQAEVEVANQRSEMRERIEAERERVQQIFDCIPDEILVVDTEMTVQTANQAFLRKNDLSIEAVRGLRCYEVDQSIRGECQVAVKNCPFFEVLQHRKPVSLVRKHFTQEGVARYAAIVAAPLLDHGDELVGMIEMTRDITHRILLEEELKATEIRLQQFMENAPVATYVKNRHGQYMDVNQAASVLFGRQKNEILGKTDLEILPREAAETMREGDREVLTCADTFNHESEVLLNGRRVFLSSVKFPLLDPLGRVDAVCGLSVDVTAQREAQDELDRTREHLQNILDNSPALIITTDLDSNIVSFNRGASECLGYDASEIIGESAASLYRDPEERRDLLRRVLEHGAVRDYETDLIRKDSTLVRVSITLSQLRNTEGETIGTVGISKDISHRKALMDQIIQSERMAAVGRLAAGVAHEINNPLAVIGEIAGYLDDIASGGPGSEEAELVEELKDGLPKIERQVKRGRNITSRLLSIARKTEARVKKTDVAAALEEVIPFLEKEARLLQVKLTQECRGEVAPVLIEEIQLQEVFINLIQNAIQALAPQRQGTVQVVCEQEGKRVKVTVADNGPGIAEEVRDKLFDPFVTTKPLGKGTGLGLSICYGIVKRHDGEITVYSEPGQGATFEVSFPAATPDS